MDNSPSIDHQMPITMLLKICQSTHRMVGHSWTQPIAVSYKILIITEKQRNSAFRKLYIYTCLRLACWWCSFTLGDLLMPHGKMWNEPNLLFPDSFIHYRTFIYSLCLGKSGWNMVAELPKFTVLCLCQLQFPVFPRDISRCKRNEIVFVW